MQEDELLNITAKTSEIMDLFAQNIEKQISSFSESKQKLDQTNRIIPEIISQSLKSESSEISNKIITHVTHGINQPIFEFSKHIKNSKNNIDLLLQNMSVELNKMQKFNHRLLFATLSVITVTLFILIFGSVYLVNYYKDQISFYQNQATQNQLSAQFIQALHSSALVICGSGNLCIKPDKNQHNVKVPSGYLLVAPRLR